MRSLRTRIGLLALLAPFVAATAGADPDSDIKRVFFCTGKVTSTSGAGPAPAERKASSSVVIEIEAGRVVLIGDRNTAVFDILRTTVDGPHTVFHFGGIAGEIVYKGTFTTPEFRLRVVGSGAPMRIEIAMNCDGSEPLRLF